MKTNQLLKFFAVAMLILITFSLPVQSVAAKGNFSKVVVKDLETMNEIVVTEPALLGFFALSDFKGGIKDGPQVRRGYEITRYFQNDSGDYSPFDRLYYYPSSEDSSGYIFYEGLINGWSEYDGKWFQTSLEGEQIMNRLLTEQAKPSIIEQSPMSLPVTGGSKPDWLSWKLMALGSVLTLLGGFLLKGILSRFN